MRVLIVEDSSNVRAILSGVLAPHGFDIRESAGMAAARDVFDSDWHPDLVYLDWDLPKMGALDVLRALADVPFQPRVILTITENDPRLLALARAAGAAYHLFKPYDRPAIEGSLRQAGVIDDLDPPTVRTQRAALG